MRRHLSTTRCHPLREVVLFHPPNYVQRPVPPGSLTRVVVAAVVNASEGRGRHQGKPCDLLRNLPIYMTHFYFSCCCQTTRCLGFARTNLYTLQASARCCHDHGEEALCRRSVTQNATFAKRSAQIEADSPVDLRALPFAVHELLSTKQLTVRLFRVTLPRLVQMSSVRLLQCAW